VSRFCDTVLSYADGEYVSKAAIFGLYKKSVPADLRFCANSAKSFWEIVGQKFPKGKSGNTLCGSLKSVCAAFDLYIKHNSYMIYICNNLCQVCGY
jgi:hypothetical protein